MKTVFFGENSSGKIRFNFNDQRSVGKFLLLEDHSAAEIHQILVQKCGKKDAVRERCKHFKNGDQSLEGQQKGNKESIVAIEEAFYESRTWSL